MRRLRRLVSGIAIISLAFLASAAVSVGAAAKSAQSMQLPKSIFVRGESFANKVETIGTTHYPASYAGVVTTSKGFTIVYVVPSNDAKFRASVTVAASRTATHYLFVPVRHTWKELLDLTTKIGQLRKQLAASGIILSTWGPDPRTNRVSITLESYNVNAARTLTARFGREWINVVHTHGTFRAEAAAGRRSDTSPFSGGDAIWYDHEQPPSYGYKCTSGLSFTGNNSGNEFGTTAGHCLAAYGGELVFTNNNNPQLMGNVGTEYFPSQPLDIMSIANESFDGAVWGSSGNYVITGQAFPQVGDNVAVSGVTTNEVDDVPVTATDQSLCLYTTATQCYNINDLTYVSKPGVDIIQPGDSGGPVISRIGGTGNANGAGDISGFFSHSGVADYTSGFYTQIGAILRAVNGSLITGG